MGSTRARTPWARASAAVTRESDQPARSQAVRARCVARSRSPSRNQVGNPSPPRAARQVKASPARPHPLRRGATPASVLTTVSRSGATWSPKNSSSSPVLPMTVSCRGSVRRMRPERNRAPPTPPASTVTRMWLPDPSVEGRALDRDAAHGAHERLDLLDRGVLARVRARLARDALLHERAAEVVAAGAQRELREAMAELHPRGLQVVDEAAQHEAAGGVDAEVAQAFRPGRDDAIAVELGVLPDEAERYELGEAAGLLLDAAQEVDVACDVPRGLDVPVHDGRRGGHAQTMRGGDDLDPAPHVHLLVGEDLAHLVVEDLGRRARDAAQAAVAQHADVGRIVHVGPPRAVHDLHG